MAGPDAHAQRGGPRYRRFLGYAVLGSLVPGVGLLAAGRKLAGTLVLAAWLGLVAGVVTGVVILGRDGLLTLGSDPASLRTLGAALLVIAGLWLLVAVISLFVLQPPGLGGWQRLSGAAAVVAVMSVIVAPLGLGSQYTQSHTDMIERVFTTGERPSLTGPTEPPDAADPWSGRPRVNVLLLGSDAAEGRHGARPDTLIVASVDTETGDAVLLSLPRNLERVPFPADSPLSERYPNGYDGPGDRAEWMLNAVYEFVPAANPDVFAESPHPGADATKWAVEGALGLDLDYFVMLNLEGFRTLVDALGGITIDVHYRVPIGTELNPATGRCTQARDWIEPGLGQRLDGSRALWYARARCGPPPVTDDFNRMERQRCVIGAIIDEARPMTLLRHYQQLAGAAGDMVVTDIPQQLLPAFVDLATRVQEADLSSLAFTDEVLDSRSRPDFDRIQELTAAALQAQPEQVSQDEPADGVELDEAGDGTADEDDTTGEDGTADHTDERPGDDLDPTVPQPVDALC